MDVPNIICNICNKPLDEDTSYHFAKYAGYIGSCCLPPITLDEVDEIAKKYRERDKPKPLYIDTRNWYLLTFTSEIGAPDAAAVIKATLTKFYKSKMFKGEKYHVWEINAQGMLHAHALLITTGYCPHKDKLKHKWFVDVTKLQHKQFNYLIKNLDDPIHIETKQTLQLADNLPNAPQIHAPLPPP